MVNIKNWGYRRKLRRAHKKMERLADFKHFKKACKRAEIMAQDSRKRYRVFLFDRYYAWCKEDITRFKNRGVLSKEQETGILSSSVLYDTQGHANLHPQFSDRVVYNPKSFWNKILGR